jgi:multicomponent Na+:H+ antiporter subunit D
VSENLPALQVVLPLVSAALCLVLRRAFVVRLFATAVAWACFAIALALLARVEAGGPISYALGGWAPPLGIEYRVDSLNAYVLVIVTAIAAAVFPFPLRGREVRIPRSRHFLFYASLLLALTGLLGIAITGDLFNVFVFLEISSLAAYTLISLGRDRRALSAAFSYLVMGSLGAGFILIGIGLAYQMTGTLNMADLAVRLDPVRDTRTLSMAFAFLIVGTGIKLAIFPLHQWLPNAYTYAPSLVAGFLSATATKVAFYFLARLVFTVFGVAFAFESMGLGAVLLPASVAALFVGSIAAAYQTDLKRLLAYSSIAQIGYMTLGLALLEERALTGSLLHLFNHALIKGGLFLAAGCVVFRLRSSALADMRGLARRMPLTAMAIVVGGLGLVGVPGTAGFVSKWYLVWGALEGGHLLVAFLLLASSLVAAIYVWKVVEVMIARDGHGPEVRCEAPASMWVPTWALIGASLYFGLQPQWSIGIASQAARSLLAGAP